jgi:hypothetical protein
LQLTLSIFCWGILALAVAYAIKSYLLKPVAFSVVLAFSLSRDIFMWDPFLGSESVALSMTALFIASALWLVTDWRAYKLPVLILTGFLVAFARDASAYLLLLAAVVLLPFLLFSNRRSHLTIIIVSFLAIFIASASLARVSLRQYANFLSVTAFRIFPNPEYVAYFQNLGMPIDESLVEQSHYSLIPGYPKYGVLAALFADPKEESYRTWVKKDGMKSYLKFLWFFKADTMQKMFTDDQRNIFYPDVYYYTATGYTPILKSEQMNEILYPTHFAFLLFIFSNVAAALACGFAINKRKGLWLVPISMIFFTYPQAFIAWNGDANEIPRHSVEHNVMERLGVWILVFFVLDVLIQFAQPYIWKGWEQLRLRVRPAQISDEIKSDSHP